MSVWSPQWLRLKKISKQIRDKSSNNRFEIAKPHSLQCPPLLRKISDQSQIKINGWILIVVPTFSAILSNNMYANGGEIRGGLKHQRKIILVWKLRCRVSIYKNNNIKDLSTLFKANFIFPTDGWISKNLKTILLWAILSKFVTFIGLWWLTDGW